MFVVRKRLVLIDFGGKMKRVALSKTLIWKMTGAIFLFAVLCLLLTGCDFNGNRDGQLYLENYSEEPIVVEVGEFNYDDYTIIAEFSDGTKQSAVLSQDMIGEIDKMYFYRIGEYEINVQAFNLVGKFKLNIVRKTFSNITFEDKTIVYDNKEHSINVEGAIPAGTTISYIPSNSFTSVGNYQVTAVLINSNYQTLQLKANLIIEPAVYDLSYISFESKTYDYDGLRKYLAINEDLPNEVSVVYTINGLRGNSAVNAGIYEVVASFTSTNKNYAQIPNLSAVLTINKAQYDVGELSLISANYVYDGQFKTLVLNGRVPNGVSVSYTTNGVAGNGATDVGEYEIVAHFISNDYNYEDLEPISAVLTIAKADFVLSNVELNSTLYVYDGQAHSLIISGEPTSQELQKYSNITITYTINDEQGNTAINAGEYIVRAIISQDNPNYINSYTLSSSMIISKAVIEIENLSLTDATFIYDGQMKSLELHGDIPSFITVCYTTDGVEGNGAIEVGEYEVIATFITDNSNYQVPDAISGILTIKDGE